MRRTHEFSTQPSIIHVQSAESARNGLYEDLSARHDEAMTFTVWREGRYEQVHATVRERWIGIELESYRPRAVAER